MRQFVSLCPLALLLASLLSSRCGGEWSFVIPPWDAGRPSSSFASACAAWAENVCSYEDRCPSPIYFRWTSHAQCVDRSTVSCELTADDPNVAFDASLAASCLYPADCTSGLPPPLCLTHPGRAPPGSVCVRDSDCQSWACKHPSDTAGSWSSCGVCLRPCDLSCAEGRVCTYDADGGPGCTKPPTYVGIGETCSPSRVCAAGYCGSGNASGMAKVCTPFASLGESCGDGQTGPPCIGADTYCDDTQHCSVFLPAGYGETCGTAPERGARACSTYAWCDVSGAGRCVPPAPDGALCDLRQGLSCLPPAACIEHHCLFPSLSDCSL